MFFESWNICSFLIIHSRLQGDITNQPPSLIIICISHTFLFIQSSKMLPLCLIIAVRVNRNIARYIQPWLFNVMGALWVTVFYVTHFLQLCFVMNILLYGIKGSSIVVPPSDTLYTPIHNIWLFVVISLKNVKNKQCVMKSVHRLTYFWAVKSLLISPRVTFPTFLLSASLQRKSHPSLLQ